MKFYRGFKFAVHESFENSLRLIAFQTGDIFYDSIRAYSSNWSEAKQHIKTAIQIPSFQAVNLQALLDEKSDSDASIVLERNWTTPINVEVLTEFDTNVKTEHISTTQGRLFETLRTGDLSILKSDIPPLFVSIPKKNLKDIRTHPKLQDYIDELIENHTNPVTEINKKHYVAIVREVFEVSSVSKANISKISKATKGIGGSYYVFYPDEVEGLSEDIAKSMGVYNTQISPFFHFQVYLFFTGKVEDLRDKLKAAFWVKKAVTDKTKTLQDFCTETNPTWNTRFDLENYVYFKAWKQTKLGEKILVSFNHKPIYRYRYYRDQWLARSTPQIKNLGRFLDAIVTNCPNHLYSDEKSVRCSKFDFPIEVDLIHSKNGLENEMVNLAYQARSFEKFKSRHENTQLYFLENDSNSIAVEIPIWLEKSEILDFADYFSNATCITGHIDLLRIESDGKIGVWDYKPNAAKEKKASSQIFLYAFILAFRTGIPLKQFKCGYFDEFDCFTFSPNNTIFK